MRWLSDNQNCPASVQFWGYTPGSDDKHGHYVCYMPPFPQIDIIGAVVIVWRVRGKTIRSVLCNIVCNNCAQCDAHTYEQT